MAFHLQVVDGTTLNADLVALRFSKGSGLLLFMNPKILLFSWDGGGRLPVPPLSEITCSGSLKVMQCIRQRRISSSVALGCVITRSKSIVCASWLPSDPSISMNRFLSSTQMVSFS